MKSNILNLGEYIKVNFVEGQTFSTTTGLYRACGFEYTRSPNKKKAIEKQIKSHMEYIKTNKINPKTKKVSGEVEIIKIYSEPKSIEDKRGVLIDRSQFCVLEDLKNYGGIYSIILHNNIYIGQTNNFEKRFCTHIRNYNKIDFKTYELLNKGAVFKIICIEDNEVERLKLEKEYIYKYSSDNNWICINKMGIYKNKKASNKNIKVKCEDYDLAINILKQNGVEVVEKSI